MKIRVLVIIFFLAAITVIANPASAADTETIPPALEQWKSWVLHGMEERFCPSPYNNGNIYMCTWPSRLKLDLHGKGGRFTQRWIVFKKGWIPLPGGPETWPGDVKVNGKAVPVTEKRRIPSIHMVPGSIA